jgi:ribosomal protein S18 acetylase RimI-like enzyme
MGPTVMAGCGPRVMPCPVEARGAALEVLYRRVPAVLRDRLIADVLDEARRGEVDLSGLWVARDRAGRITAALLTQLLAGRAAAVWAPEVRVSWRRSALAAALVAAALADLKARGVRLAQAVLDESAEPRAGGDLTRGGMPRVTELVYLERDTAIPLPPSASTDRLGRGSPDFDPDSGSVRRMTEGLPARPESGPDFEWRLFDPALEAEFRAVLQATYVGSLDMPELEGVRGLDDILGGHRAAGVFVPGRWRLGRLPGEPAAAAVLLMAAVAGRDAWEVVYLGLTPAARGRGLGRAVLRHALELARDQVPRLELAVDIRNTPAVRLYRAAGFTVRDRRAVHLAVFPAPESGPVPA